MAGPDGGTGRGKDPLRAALPLGTVGGIPVRVNWSAAVIFALIAFGLAAWDFPAVDPHQSALTYVLAGVLTTAVYLASLLAHELAHSLVARRYGVPVKSITLWLLGGISELGGEAPGPAAEARIAGAGPLTSLVLGGIFIGLAVLAGTGHPARASIPGVIVTALAYLGVSNVVLAVFNVIPAAPLDGGRLLRAVVWWRTGDKVKATVWAGRAGQVFGRWLGYLMIFAVLSSTVADTQTTLLPASRLTLSMARDGVFPPAFRKVQGSFQTPMIGTLILAGLCLFGIFLRTVSPAINTGYGNLIADIGVLVGFAPGGHLPALALAACAVGLAATLSSGRDPAAGACGHAACQAGSPPRYRAHPASPLPLRCLVHHGPFGGKDLLAEQAGVSRPASRLDPAAHGRPVACSASGRLVSPASSRPSR